SFCFLEQKTAYEMGNTEPVSADLQIISQGSTIILNTAFSMQWLNDNARVFPLHLDPTISYFPQNVNFWTGYQTSSTGKANGYLRIAAAGTACWAKFDISTLPAAAVVQTAEFFGY